MGEWVRWEGTNVIPTCGETYACENITFPQLRLRAVKMSVVADSLNDRVLKNKEKVLAVL